MLKIIDMCLINFSFKHDAKPHEDGANAPDTHYKRSRVQATKESKLMEEPNIRLKLKINKVSIKMSHIWAHFSHK